MILQKYNTISEHIFKRHNLQSTYWTHALYISNMKINTISTHTICPKQDLYTQMICHKQDLSTHNFSQTGSLHTHDLSQTWSEHTWNSPKIWSILQSPIIMHVYDNYCKNDVSEYMRNHTNMVNCRNRKDSSNIRNMSTRSVIQHPTTEMCQHILSFNIRNVSTRSVIQHGKFPKQIW